MTAQNHQISGIKTWLRDEALTSGDSTVYKAFIRRSANTKVWPFVVNGDVTAFALTEGGRITTFHTRKDGEDRWRATAINSILAEMADRGHVTAWVAETDPEKRTFWRDLGFVPDEDGFSYERLSGPVDLSKVRGIRTPFEVKFYSGNRWARPDKKPFAVHTGSGKLTHLQELHLPERAIAFDGRVEINLDSIFLSVSVGDDLVAETHVGSATAAELGVKTDPAGVPYIDVIDLYTHKL